MANLSNINNKFLVTTGGDVGINTTSPNARLHVNGTTFLEGTFGNPNTDAAYRIKFYDNGGVYNDAGIGLDGSGGGSEKMWFNAYSGFYWNQGTQGIKMMLDGTGRLGIGTDSPSTDLHVNSENAEGSLTLSRGGNNMVSGQGIGSIVFPADYNGTPTNYGKIVTYANALSALRGSIDFKVKSTSGSLLTGLTLYGTSSGVNVGIGTDSPVATLQVGPITATAMSQIVGKARIVGTNYIPSSTQMGTLDIASTTRTSSAPFNQGFGPSITFSQNISGYVDGYEVVIGAIKSIVTSGSNTGQESAMTFLVNGGTSTGVVERMRIAEDGNVGIGTTTPNTKLEIFGNNSARNTLQNILAINGGTSSNNVYSGFGMGLVFNGRDYSNQPRDYAYIYGVQQASSTSTPGGDPGFTSQLTFYTNTGGAVNTLPTQKMVINALGNVGINVTNPGFQAVDGYGQIGIEIKGGKENNQAPCIRLHETGSGKGSFELRSTRNVLTSGNYFAIAEGTDTFFAIRGDDDGGGVGTRGNVGIGTISPGALLDVVAPNSGGAARQDMFRLLQTGQNTLSCYMYGGTTDLVQLHVSGTEQNLSLTTGGVATATTATGIHLRSGGDVGIGTLSPSAKLDINGDVRYRGNTYNQLTYQVTGNYSANTWYTAATSATLTESGIYILVVYLNEFSAGGGNYYVHAASTNFYWDTTSTNRVTAFNFPPLLGTGHATGNIPLIRITQEMGSSGAQSKIQWQNSYTYTNLTANLSGKQFTLYFKKIGG